MASVVAREDMDLLAISRDDFLTAVTNRGDAAAVSGPAHVWSVSTDLSRRERTELLSRVSLLSHLDMGALGTLADASVVDRWPAGTPVVHQGDDGDRFFVLIDGRAIVSVAGEKVAELHPGDQFGEIAILHGVPRQADVVTASPAATLSLHRDDLLPAVRTRLLLG
jgi:CRP-like cAMP-binding protein